MNGLAPYDHVTFSNLHSLFDADALRHTLSLDLEEFGWMLKKFELHRVVGLALLHRHFSMDHTERLVERLDYDDFVSITSPRDVSSGHLVPHLLKVGTSDKSGQYHWQPLEFVEQDDARNLCERGLQEVLKNAAFLDNFAKLLEVRNAISVLGISVLHGREKLLRSQSEVLVEGPGAVKRTLRLAPSEEDHPDVLAGIQTVWVFDGKRCRMACTCQDPQDHRHLETN